MKTFREEEHPRDNDGKFSSKGGNTVDSLIDKYSDTPSEDKASMGIGTKQVKKDQWRRYYKKIMDGDFYYLNKTNKRVVYIDNLLMIDDGKDKTKSKVITIKQFGSEDDLADYLLDLKFKGVLK